MISQRIIPAIPPRGRYLLARGRYLLAGGRNLLAGGRNLLAGGLCLLGLVVLPTRLPAEPINFGEGFVYAGCLHIVAESYLDRQGEVDNHDWVTLRVTNNCKAPIKHLRVALVLLDAGGAPYGTADWLLERGIYLPPGKSRVKKIAVPDSDNRIAVRWEVKVLQVSKVRSKALGGRRRRN